MTLATVDDDWQGVLQKASTPFDVVSVTNLFNVSPWYGPGLLRRPARPLTQITFRKVTEALFAHITKADHPVLDPKSGTLAMYCCLKRKGQFQSEADEKVRHRPIPAVHSFDMWFCSSMLSCVLDQQISALGTSRTSSRSRMLEGSLCRLKQRSVEAQICFLRSGDRRGKGASFTLCPRM